MELLRAPTELCLSAAHLVPPGSSMRKSRYPVTCMPPHASVLRAPTELCLGGLCHVSAPLLHLVLVNIPVLGLRKMSRFVLLLAASATALNLGVPVLRSTRPSLRRVRTGRFARAPCCLTHTAT